jgi:hypothetical protein
MQSSADVLKANEPTTKCVKVLVPFDLAAMRRHCLGEGSRAVFMAASPVARETLDGRRASVECLELTFRANQKR